MRFDCLRLILLICLTTTVQAGPLCQQTDTETDIAPLSLPSELQSSETQTQIETDFQRWDMQGNSTFEGNVTLTQGNQSISAEKLQLSNNDQQLIATGMVKLLSPMVHIEAAQLHGNLSNKNMQFSDTAYQFQQTPTRGNAARIDLQQQKKQMTLYQSSLTTCPEQQEAWKLTASEIQLDGEEGWGTAKHIRLNVHDVPVFYFPYLRFPLTDERQSGFLFPKIRYSSNNGLDLEVPYYLNLAPHYDATITPRYMLQRGIQLQNEFRYLSPFGNNELHVDLLPNDRQFQDGNQERILFSFEQQHRYSENWYSELNYIEVSDDDYFNDLGAYGSIGSHERLTRELNAGYQSANWRFNMQVKNYQLLTHDEKPYEIKPELEYHYDYADQHTGLRWQLLSKFNAFDHDDKVTSQRLLLKPRLSYPISWPSGYFIPSVSYDIAFYQQNLDNATEEERNVLSSTPKRAVPSLSLHSGIWLERELNLGSSAYTQTLEPQIHYLYTPYQDQDDIGLYDTTDTSGGFDSLFRENRFLGYDRVGEANQITLAISTKIIRHDTGEERLSFRLGRSFYRNSNETVQLSADEEKPTSSPYIADFEFKITDDWAFDTSLEWDTKTSKTLEGGTHIHYQPENNTIVDISHRYRLLPNNQVLEQLTTALSWPVSDQWNLLGRWQTDLVEAQTLEASMGLEYSDCCWAVRLVARRYLDQFNDNDETQGEFKNSIYFQFVLKGLSTLGNDSLGEMLQKQIPGYNRNRLENFGTFE